MTRNKIPNCIIDARVSTPKQLEGSGLTEQKLACKYFVDGKGWQTKRVFAKTYSGAKEYRGDFEIIKDYIRECQKSGIKIDYYVFRSIDRFTRLGGEVLMKMKREIESLGVQLVDVEGIIQPKKNELAHHGIEFDWSVHSPSDGNVLARAEEAKSDRRRVLTRLIGAEIGLDRQGYSMRAPLDGYLNIKQMIKGGEMTVLAQDVKRAYFRKTAFEMRASQKYSDDEIVAHINSLGFLSKRQRRWRIEGEQKMHIGYTIQKPMTVKQLQKSISYTMYAGVKNNSWNKKKPVWAVFAEGETPIVSIELFNKANRGKVYIELDPIGNPTVFENYTGNFEKKTRRKHHSDYRYDKMVLCGVCQKPLKNSGKGNKGKTGKYHQAHHCDRTPDCKKLTGRIPKDKFEKQVFELLNRIRFNDSLTSRLEEKLIKKYREREAEIVGRSATISENVAELKREQESLLISIGNVQSTVVMRNLEERIESLEIRIQSAVEQREKIEITEKDVKSFVKYAKEIVEHPIKMLANNSNPLTQQALFNLVFDETPTYAQIVNGTPKLSFIFKLSDSKTTDKSSLVIPRRIELRFPG